MTPEALHQYARRFAKRHEAAGKGTVWPTLQQCAKRFRTTVSKVEEMVEESENNLDLLVGIGIPGVGSADLPHSHWQVEAY